MTLYLKMNESLVINEKEIKYYYHIFDLILHQQCGDDDRYFEIIITNLDLMTPMGVI